MVKEVEVKNIINRMSKPSSWFGVEYNMNVYRGCQHHCIYCDSRSSCYRVENFDTDVTVKINAPEILNKQLSRMRKRYTIGTGAMSDPYMPIERQYELTRQCLEVIDKHAMRVHLATKSNLVLRDIDVLERISKRYASIAVTVTTMDEALAKVIEPDASTPIERMEAVGILNSLGIKAGILMQPQLPYLMEDHHHIDALVEAFVKYEVQFVYPSFGMTLRDGNRQYYYKKLKEYAPEIVAKYEKRFGTRYGCSCINWKKLKTYFNKRCQEAGIYVGMPLYAKEVAAAQMSIFMDNKGDKA